MTPAADRPEPRAADLLPVTAPSLDDGRGGRVVHFALAKVPRHRLAERGGRVFHRAPVAASANTPSKGDEVKSDEAAWLRPVAMPPVPAEAGPRPTELEAALAAPSALSRAVSAPLPEPEPAAETRLASLETTMAGPSLADTASSPANIPLPLFRPAEADSAAEIAGHQSPEAASVAVPAARPQHSPAPERRVASLEPQEAGVADAAVAAGLTPPGAPLPQRRPARQPAAALSYARPDAPEEKKPGAGGFFDRLFHPNSASQLPGPGSHVAVYAIDAATVYLPNGGRLEAHSGLGQMQDDPRYVTQKNRGPTPPNIYDLVMREGRFHGAEAIRLLPSDGRKKFNRDGLLAHPYMYIGGGSRSQSNGCVVFKDYKRFLQAFKDGRIERLIVVPSLDKLPTYMAAL